MKEMNREAAPDFMKELAGAIVHKIKSAIDGVAGHGISTNVTSTREEISSRLFGENKSLDYIADVFAKTIMETTLMKPNASSVGDDREEFRSRYSPSAKYESCPPLGTPVLSNDFLVRLSVFTVTAQIEVSVGFSTRKYCLGRCILEKIIVDFVGFFFVNPLFYSRAFNF